MNVSRNLESLAVASARLGELRNMHDSSHEAIRVAAADLLTTIATSLDRDTTLHAIGNTVCAHDHPGPGERSHFRAVLVTTRGPARLFLAHPIAWLEIRSGEPVRFVTALEVASRYDVDAIVLALQTAIDAHLAGALPERVEQLRLVADRLGALSVLASASLRVGGRPVKL